jgi:acyl-CoA synthetase (AMP-forming)/AMP-acid ligase II
MEEGNGSGSEGKKVVGREHGEGPIERATTLYELFEMRCATSSSSSFLIIEEEEQLLRRVTFGELGERVKLIRKQLAVQGLRRGSVAILLLERSELFVEAILAVWSLGGVAFVPNWRIPSTKLEELIQSSPSGVRHLICSWQFYRFADEWKSARVVDHAYLLLPSKLELETFQTLYNPSSPSLPIVFLSRHRQQHNNEVEETRPLPDDTALILHSSGTTTTGLPKLCPTTHRGLLWNQRQTTHLLKQSSAITQKEDGAYDACISLGMLPFYHTIGLLVDFLGTLYRGSQYTFPTLTTDQPTNDDHGFRSFIEGLSAGRSATTTTITATTTMTTLTSVSTNSPTTITAVGSSAISARELLLRVSKFGATHLYCVPLVLHYFRDMIRSEAQ